MYTTLYYRNVFLLYSFFFVQFFSGCHFQSCKKAVASILVNCATMHMQINSSSRQTRRKISVWEVFLSCSINKCMALSRLYFHFIKREKGKNTRTFWLIWPLHTRINNSVAKEKTCVYFFRWRWKFGVSLLFIVNKIESVLIFKNKVIKNICYYLYV